MRKTMTALTMAALVALVAAPVVAQGHHGAQQDSARGGMGMMQGQPGMMQGGMMQMMQGMRGQHGMMGGGMMGMMGMAAGPGTILRLQESLELTGDQVAQLEALRDSAARQMRQHMMQGMQGMRSASELLGPGSTDLEGYEAGLREASNHMVLAHTAMARAGVEARELLTPEQRERLDLAREVMKQMQGGMMPGGMMQDSMMQDSMMQDSMMQDSMMQDDAGANGGHHGG